MDFLDIDDIPSFDEEATWRTPPHVPQLSPLPAIISPLPPTPPNIKPQEQSPRTPPSCVTGRSPLELLPWRLIALTLSPPKRRQRLIPPPAPVAIPKPIMTNAPTALLTQQKRPVPITKKRRRQPDLAERLEKFIAIFGEDVSSPPPSPTRTPPPVPQPTMPPPPNWKTTSKRCRRSVRLPDGRRMRLTRYAHGNLRMGKVFTKPVQQEASETP